MGDFLDELLERRIDFNEGPEARFAGRLRGVLELARRDIQKKIDGLKSFTNIDGEFVDLTSTRAATKAVSDDIAGLLKEADKDMVAVLKDGKIASFKRGAVDVQFATETGGAGEISLGRSFSQVFDQALPKVANSKVLGIGPNKEFKAATKFMREEVRRTLTRAVANGESINKTADKINKTMNRGKGAATRVARTNLNAAMNDGHRAVYDSNPDIYKGYRWDATLDSRTSTICAALHGTFWPLGSNPPGPPAHPNCRSVLAGVFEDDEVQNVIDNSKRRARNAQGKNVFVKSDIKFDDWLRDKPDAFQRKIIGSDVKHNLWKQKKIKLTDMVSDGVIVRSDKSVVERAMARRPKDDALKNLGKDLKAKRIDAEELARQDLREARRADFNVGVRVGTAQRVAEAREKIDERKRKATDFINRSAARVAKRENKL